MSKRRDFLKYLGFSWLYPVANTETVKDKKEIPLFEFCIAGFQYYDGLKEVRNLKAGEELVLKKEPGNIHDEYAIEIYTKTGKKLGYVPMESNVVPNNILDLKIELKAVITEVNPEAEPWEMVWEEMREVV